jgi:hypothetical protein
MDGVKRMEKRWKKRTNPITAGWKNRESSGAKINGGA